MGELAFGALVRGWPGDQPLAAIWSGRDGWGLAAEPRGTFRVERGADGVCRSSWIDRGWRRPAVEFAHDPAADLRAMLAWGEREGRSRERPPGGGLFQGGWIGFLSYDLGRVMEPAVERGPGRAEADRTWPLIELHWCPSALMMDSRTGEAAPVGLVASDGPARRQVSAGRRARTGALESHTGREGFERAAARAIEYIRAGDVFQVNLAHRLSGSFKGSTRKAFAALCRAASPWHSAYVEVSNLAQSDRAPRALLSASPELFLEVTPSPEGVRVVTRPMKGTRPASADPRELERSAKDRAELNMIIDLMRNDLGRVCRVGSVRVEDPRAIERHGGASGVLQGVATVSGVLREGTGIVDLLCAAFPPGSVTGAPKIRAMQIIDELEPVRRGPYCGSAGWISTTGAATLNVAIRTALVSGRRGEGALDEVEDGVIDYSVGAGIVADSDPAAEWRETLDKAGAILSLAASEQSRRSRATGVEVVRPPLRAPAS